MSCCRTDTDGLGAAWKFWRRRRYVVAFLAFLGFFNVYALRVNLSVAIVAMTAIRNTTLSNGTTIIVSRHIQIQHNSEQWHHHYCELAHSNKKQHWTVAPPLLWVGTFRSKTTLNSGTTIIVSWHIQIQHNSEQWHHHYCELAHSNKKQHWAMAPPLLWVGTFSECAYSK